ncbi:MAG: leucine-rich repeat domain-containing protein [Oscillospiraceae bacterium]
MEKTSRKVLSVALALIMVLCCLPIAGVTFSASAEYEGYYYYSVENGEATITDCDTSISGDVVIPDTLGGYPVTSIGEKAFAGCTGLTSITIGNSVTSIGRFAFSDCAGLTSVTIPDSVTSIGYYAFRSCIGLTSITIPDSVTSIGDYAFFDCTGLTIVTVSSGNTVYHSTDNCLIETKSKTLILGCNNSFIPSDGSVSNIGNRAFAGCTGLTSVTIPDSVTSIGYDAFYNCTSLTSITIPDSVTSIDNYAFGYCTGLTSVTIGNSVTSIGYGAFSDCTGLTSVTIGNSVTSIGGYAFADCTGLTSVTIGNSVTSISYGASYGCTGLTDVYYSGSEEEWGKIEIGSYNVPLGNATIHYNSSGPDDPDPDDESYDNYEDNEEIRKQLSGYSVITGKMESYVLSVILNSSNESYVSEITIDKTVYPVAANVLSDSTAKMLENKNVFIAVKDGKVEWIDGMDSYVGEPYIELSVPRYSYTEKDGLRCISSEKDIIVKISYPFTNSNFILPAPGLSSSIFETNVFLEMLSHAFMTCDLYDLCLNEVKVESKNPNLKLTNADIVNIKDKNTLKVCESVEYKIPVEISSSLKVNSDEANNILCFSVDAKTSNGGLTKSGQIYVINPYYRSNDRPWDNESSGGGSQSNENAQAAKAGKILNNKPITLMGDISGSLYKLFSDEQLTSIANAIYTEVAMYKAPKKTFEETLSTKIIEEVFKCKTNLLSFGQNEISLTFAVDTQWGEVQVEFTVKSNNFGLNGSNYAFYGDIYYEIVGGKAANKLPKDIAKSGYAGALSGTDMEEFCKAVWSVAQGQLKSAYNIAYGNDLNTAVDIIFGKSVNKVLKHTKYGSVSGLTWQLLVTPSTKVVIECPVDVLVYDSDNKLVASIVNNEITSNTENVQLSIEDDAKIVQLFDDSYHIEYVPFAEGKMSVTTEELGFSDGFLNSTLIKDVPLNVGVTYKQTVANSYIEASDYSLISSEAEKYDADEYSTVFHTHVSDGTIYYCDASTCTLHGAEYKYCSICNNYYCELLPLLEHNDADNNGMCDSCGEKLDETEPENPSANCTCNCHKTGFMGFIWKILRFFYKLFGTNKVCTCGQAHY